MSHPDEIIIGIIKRNSGWYWWTCDADTLREAGFLLEVDKAADIGPFVSHHDAWMSVCENLKEVEKNE